jgi:hypothetical protein
MLERRYLGGGVGLKFSLVSGLFFSGNYLQALDGAD